jgi:ATP-dependent helicase HepA
VNSCPNRIPNPGRADREEPAAETACGRAPGQRWISVSEPELGLGTVVAVTAHSITLEFPAARETRQYAIDNAPLRRVRFREGDRVTGRDGRTFVIRRFRESAGALIYIGDGIEIAEAELADRTGPGGPEARLLAGQFDPLEAFAFRVQAARFQHHYRYSPVRGLVGARIDLIPHQLYIAHEVSGRHAPRVLLSDEVGLGKTIEACLIVHRLLRSGRVARVLIVVPESLVHQWFVEMWRRFNVWLPIYDEERCAAIERVDGAANPFLDEQLVLCSLEFLVGSARRAAQAQASTWDVLVVDEAHHLEWNREHSSPGYRFVEALSRQTEGLLLLTATPEQLGPESHFARLRLLDPERYADYDAFTLEADHYRSIARFVERLQSDQPIPAADGARLKQEFPHEAAELDTFLAAVDSRKPGARQELIDNLLDWHGPGRVILRNTRGAMRGFPTRKVHLVPLEPGPESGGWLDRLSTEFAIDAGDTHLQRPLDLQKDPRVDWLAATLRALAPRKVLLICRSPAKVLALESALRERIQLPCAVFHEQLTLLQRDRNAAWFAEEDGARLLLCSEIGSEGRNFQFAHNLVLFDLPLNPELLEQRIGRLDRIGQTRDIQVHVPYLKHSPHEVLARWYHEGLDAFEHHLEGGNELFREFGREVHDLALEFPALTTAEAAPQLSQLIERTARARHALRTRLEAGRDRLLELNSYRPQLAQRLIEDIRREDRHPYLESFLLEAFEHFGVQVEELAPRTYHLDAHGALTSAFPSVPDQGLTATFDRARAVGREDVGFLTWDHPMVTGVIDLILGSETGNCTFALWPLEQKPTLLLEVWFVLEVVADARLHADRFLPATPVRAVLDARANDVTDTHPKAALDKVLRPARPPAALAHPRITGELLPTLLETARTLGTLRARRLIEEGSLNMNRLLAHEIERLLHLQRVNRHIRPREIELARLEQERLAEAIANARLRLDAVRLIWQGPDSASQRLSRAV